MQFYQNAILSKCHFIKNAILSKCHFINMPFYQDAIQKLFSIRGICCTQGWS
jgi:hypothetical protein